MATTEYKFDSTYAIYWKHIKNTLVQYAVLYDSIKPQWYDSTKPQWEFRPFERILVHCSQAQLQRIVEAKHFPMLQEEHPKEHDFFLLMHAFTLQRNRGDAVYTQKICQLHRIFLVRYAGEKKMLDVINNHMESVKHCCLDAGPSFSVTESIQCIDDALMDYEPLNWFDLINVLQSRKGDLVEYMERYHRLEEAYDDIANGGRYIKG